MKLKILNTFLSLSLGIMFTYAQQLISNEKVTKIEYVDNFYEDEKEDSVSHMYTNSKQIQVNEIPIGNENLNVSIEYSPKLVSTKKKEE